MRVARHSPMTEDSQKLRKRKSLALPSTFSRISGSGSMRAISIAPIIIEKIAKKARSLSTVRRPGINTILSELRIALREHTLSMENEVYSYPVLHPDPCVLK